MRRKNDRGRILMNVETTRKRKRRGIKEPEKEQPVR